MINKVILSRRAQKDLKQLPRYIVEALAMWVEEVETDGLEETRKSLGYHDEPLKGDRKGQRSIRLSLSYRAIYIIESQTNIKFVLIEEVNKHGY